jgi:hypothetical protein
MFPKQADSAGGVTRMNLEETLDKIVELSLNDTLG